MLATRPGAYQTAIRASSRLAFSAALLSLCSLPALGSDVPAEDAGHHIGETATVCGVVASGKYDGDLRSQPTFLDFGKAYPDQVFTAVIFGSDRAKFGTPETSLRGKRICVTGKIQDRSGLPQIILNDPKQLTQ
jgi:hypothetical protein